MQGLEEQHTNRTDLGDGRVHLVAVGTHGDVLPVLALAASLARRGRTVRLAAPAPFARIARKAGVHFQALGTSADFEAFVGTPNLWHPRRGIRPLFDYVERLYEPTHRWLAEHCDPRADVAVASTLALGARTAQEALGLQLITLHVMPFILQSRYAPPRLPGLPLPRSLPPAWRARANYIADLGFLHPAVLPKLNAFRAGLRLPPVHDLRRWWHSPDGVLLGFPSWYGSPQPDWPAQAIQVPFLMGDALGDAEGLPSDIVTFLDRGPPPLVFTYGSAMRQSRPFFETATAMCRRMKRRGILLTPQSGQVPDSLPDGVIYSPYVPLSRLLPRAAALVHHGGVGTVAQAMAAGVPQLVVPVAFDHVDEGIKVTELGVGAMLKQKMFTAAKAVRVLEALLSSHTTSATCLEVRARMSREEGVGDACAYIDHMMAFGAMASPIRAIV